MDLIFCLLFFCADLCENSEMFIMSSNRVVIESLMSWKIQVTIISCDDQNCVARNTSCPWISEIGEPFRTIVSVDVGLFLCFFFSDF